jgi:dGTPase
MPYVNFSKDFQEQFEHDRAEGVVNPWRCPDEAVVRRNPKRDMSPRLHRPPFQRDIDKILNVAPYNRYAGKTQVFSFIRNDDISRRGLHVQLVARTARSIGRMLGLNDNLIEAIALGHDLGHTPFGHAGERALNRVCPEGFRHNEQSLRLVDVLERDGRGLNLTWEVRDGILNHQTSGSPSTLEGQIVRISDKIAYFHHDMDDAMRAGILTEADVPEEITSVVGRTTGDRLDRFIHDMIRTSQGKPVIAMSEPVAQAMKNMRAFMHRRVYSDPVAKGEESKAEQMVEALYEYYLVHTDRLPDHLRAMIADEQSRARAVCDYISAMSDRFAIAKFEELFVPRAWSVL